MSSIHSRLNLWVTLHATCLPPFIHTGIFVFAMCTILKKEVDNGHPRQECNGPKLELVTEDYQQCGNDARPNRVKLEPGLDDVEMVFLFVRKTFVSSFISSTNITAFVRNFCRKS